MSRMKLKQKIIIVCVCVACLLSVVVFTCSASAVTPTSLYWCDYVKHEDTGASQYIGKNGMTFFDYKTKSDYVNTYYIYFNDITIPFTGVYASDVDVPNMVLADVDNFINPQDIDIYGEFYFSYYAYDSVTNSEIVQSVRLDIDKIDAVWVNETEDYLIYDIGSAVEVALDSLSGIVIDGNWVSISNFSLAFDAVGTTADYWEASVDVETDLLTNVYHGSLIPLDIPLGSGGGFTQDDVDNAYNRGLEEGASFGYTSGYSRGYEYGHGIGYEEGYNVGYSDGVDTYDNVGTFLSASIGSFLDTPLFGDITIGSILLIVISVPLVIFFLKLFAGG